MNVVVWVGGLFVGGLALQAQAPAVTAASRAEQPGELVVLTVANVAGPGPVGARAFDRDLPAFQAEDGTWRVLVPIDLDVKPGHYTVAIAARGTGDAAELSYALDVRDKAFPTRTLTVDEAFVNPPAAAMKQIEEDARDLQACWAASAPQRLWSAGFVRPVPQPANSAFGTRSVFNGQPRSPHSGADFLSPAGTPVKAPNSGRVVLARSLYYTGNTVVIDHGLGVFSLLAHLSAIDVTTGETVQAGDVVGRVGSTGRVTGAHLHWTVRIGGARIDPLSLLTVLGR